MSPRRPLRIWHGGGMGWCWTCRACGRVGFYRGTQSDALDCALTHCGYLAAWMEGHHHS